MANQQLFPSSSYPGNGDILTTPGSPDTVVTGLQTYPVAPTPPQTQQILVFGSDGIWHPEDPIVSGPNAPGTPSTANPVQVGGIDDGNLVREIRLDTNGAINLSLTDRTLLENILLELRAMKQAIISLDSTAIDSDYAPDNFTDQKAGI